MNIYYIFSSFFLKMNRVISNPTKNLGFFISFCSILNMNDKELLKKYQFKISTQILLFMRQKFPVTKIFTLKGLAENFDRSVGVISRELKSLRDEGLLDISYSTKNYANGARLRTSLTKRGLRFGKQIAYYWLNKNEKNMLKALNIVQT